MLSPAAVPARMAHENMQREHGGADDAVASEPEAAGMKMMGMACQGLLIFLIHAIGHVITVSSCTPPSVFPCNTARGRSSQHFSGYTQVCLQSPVLTADYAQLLAQIRSLQLPDYLVQMGHTEFILIDAHNRHTCPNLRASLILCCCDVSRHHSGMSKQ